MMMEVMMMMMMIMENFIKLLLCTRDRLFFNIHKVT